MRPSTHGCRSRAATVPTLLSSWASRTALRLPRGANSRTKHSREVSTRRRDTRQGWRRRERTPTSCLSCWNAFSSCRKVRSSLVVRALQSKKNHFEIIYCKIVQRLSYTSTDILLVWPTSPWWFICVWVYLWVCVSTDISPYVTHLDETSHMSAEFVFRYGAEMHGRAHITDSCFIAFITSKIC